MSYVKNYDVGNLRIDTPHKHFIHELPLLSFGDARNSFALSLVYQSKLTSNPYHIASGYKLSIQKKITISGGQPQSYEDGFGSLTKLNSCVGNRYAFDDGSQRFIRLIDGNYILENPDYSTEVFDTNGNILSVKDKYENEILSYSYLAGKLDTVVYKGIKTVKFIYNGNALEKIKYTYPSNPYEISFAYDNDKVTVKHYSDVDYHLGYTSGRFEVYSADKDEDFSNDYSCKNSVQVTGNVITVEKYVGEKKTDNVVYNYVNCDSDGNANILDITDFHNVTTRVQFVNEKPAYSYEKLDPMFVAEAGANKSYYPGSITFYNNEDASGSQGIDDGLKMNCITNATYTDNNRFWTPHSFSGLMTVSGWIKPITDISSCDINIYNNDALISVKTVTGLVKDTWTYFTATLYLDNSTSIMALTSETDDKLYAYDFRLSGQVTNAEEAENYKDNLTKAAGVLIHTDSDGNDHEIPITDNVEYLNGNILISRENYPMTINDLMRFKINQTMGANKGEIYYNDGRGVFALAGTFFLRYTTPEGVSITNALTNLAIGRMYSTNSNKFVTKTNIYYENGAYKLKTEAYKNGVAFKTEIYNDKLDLIESTVEGVKTTYERNTSETGLEVTKTVTDANNANVMTSSAVYNVKDYLESSTDEFGTVTTYETDDVWGVIKKSTVGTVSSVADDYDDGAAALESREFANGTDPRKTTLEYSAGNVSKITHGISNKSINFGFAYSHDALEEITRYNITKCNTAIEENALTNGDKVLTTSYPNATNPIYTVVQRTDKYGRVTKIDGLIQNEYDISPEFSEVAGYTVREIDNGSGRLASTTDLITNNTTKYAYKNGKVSKIGTFNASNTKISEESFLYDVIGRLTYDTFTYDVANGKTVGAEMSYVKSYNDPMADNRVESYYYKVNGEAKATTQTGYDPYKRVNSKYHYIGGRYFSKDITFEKTMPKTVVDKNNATTIASTSYTYDAMGRIATVAANGYTKLYTYDAYGQLIKEETKNASGTIDKTTQYVYNGIGNIESVTTTGSTGTTSTQSFTYGDSANPDRLTQFGTKAITYNAIGCPTSYNGKSFTWSKGKLASVTKGSVKDWSLPYEAYTYTYNAKGQRTSKTYFYRPPDNLSLIGNYLRNTNTSYTYDNSGRLIREKRTLTYSDFSTLAIEFIYLYDESGIIGVLFTYGDEDPQLFYYQRNLQGDVVAIYNTSGVLQAAYSYNTWGDCTVANSTNARIANYNPIRYRGYYLDSETNWYFLNARYYSPEWRRFISPDDTAYLDPKNVNGCNLYCYCGNDPINFVDPSGHSLLMILGLIGCFGVLAVGAITALSIVQAMVVEATNRMIEHVANVLKKPLNNVGRFLEEKLQNLKKSLNLTPDKVDTIVSEIIDNALNSSKYIDAYDLHGGENIFEAMWDEFYGLD